MPIDPQTQHAQFVDGVQLLGGPREAARELAVGERTMTRLVGGQSALHDGFLRDMAEALIRRADACRALERHINPLFAGNCTADQPSETGRRTGARHRRED